MYDLNILFAGQDAQVWFSIRLSAAYACDKLHVVIYHKIMCIILQYPQLENLIFLSCIGVSNAIM